MQWKKCFEITYELQQRPPGLAFLDLFPRYAPLHDGSFDEENANLATGPRPKGQANARCVQMYGDMVHLNLQFGSCFV